MYDIALIRKVTRELTSLRGCEFMKNLGYKSGSPIIAADANERLADVFERVANTDSSQAYIAVLFADQNRIAVLPLTRGHDQHTGNTQYCDTLHTDMDSQSTIGMLVADMNNRKSPVHLIIDETHNMENVIVSNYEHELV